MKTHLRKFSRIFIGTFLFFFIGIDFSKAQVGETLNFDGSNDFVEASPVTLGSAWTAEAWVKPSAVGGVNWKTILGQSYWNGNAGFVIATVNNSVFVEGPQGFHIQAPINANVWTHVAATYSNGIFALYTNGVLAGVQTGTFTNSTAPFFIGMRNDNNVSNNSIMMDAFSGNIDEVRIWNTARTQCQIQQYMNCEILGITSGLQRNYHFNDGIANGLNFVVILSIVIVNNDILTDASGNGADGILNNYALSLGGSTSNWTSPGSPAQGLSTPASASTASIAITGNGNSITDGSTSPVTTNYTDFGGSFTRTFVVTNSGSQTLNIATPVFTGPNASEFSVTVIPSSTLAASTGSTSFVVAFTPTSIGTKSAVLNMYDSECSKNIYDFAITATAVAGAALNFDGVNDNVHISDPVFGLSDFTIEGWIKPATTSTAGGFIAGSRYNEGFQTGNWWTLHCGGDAGSGRPISLELAECGNGALNYQTLNSTHSVTSGAWSHVAVVRSGSTYYLYVNGILSSQMTEYASHNLNNGFNNINIGGWPQNNSSWFRGEMDELRFWKVARTQCEIQTFMNCEVASTPTALVGNYHFNQGVASGNNSTVTLLTDASASSRTGTLGVTTYTFDLTSSVSNWVSPGAVASNYTTFTAPNVEIDVRGAGNSIIDGNTGTSTVDLTDFNGAMTRTFTIHNINPGVLAIGAPYLTGTNASEFSITTLPSASLSGVSSTTIVVAFSPTSTGVKSATINIPSSDCDEPVYDFKITATPPIAEALNFDGVNDYIETGAFITNFGQGDFTIETWIKTATVDEGILVCQDGDGTWEQGERCFMIENDGHLVFVGNGNDYIHGLSAITVTDNVWHHVAVTWDLQSGINGVGKIYIDGIDRTASSTYSAQFADQGTVKIGRPNYNESSVTFSGSMDELRIWNIARTQCEIQSFMNCEITNTLTNLVVNYHFNQGSPGLNNAAIGTVTDGSFNGYTGTLNTFLLTGSTSNWVSPGAVVSGSNTSALITSSVSVSGNGNNVPSGIVTTSLNNTDFGTNLSRSFSITNAGGGTLNIGSVYFTGPAAAQFSVSSSPSLAVTTGTTGFTIAYTPTALGSFSAVVNISTNDCVNPTYSFVITASTNPASALNFDGTNDFVALSSGTNIPVGNSPYTIESWIKPTAFGDCGIVGWGNYGTPNEVNGFRLGVGGQLINYWWGNDLMASVPTLTNGSWHHVAATFDGVIRVLYVDGVKVASDMPSGHNVPSTANLKIGVTCTTPACSGGPEYFNGGIDELRIWNIGRTQCEIQTYMNCEIPSTASGLVANYHFNQGIPSGTNTSINTLIDATGSNAGTLNNFTLIGSTSNWVSPGGVVNDYTLTSPPTAAISLSGNGNNVPLGVTTTTLNNTDFGTNPSRTFSITNSGGGTLTVGSIYFTGANASEFSVTTAPASSLTTGGSSFVIAHTPTAIGSASALVNILSNDCVNPTYSFVITASTNIADALNFNGSDYISLPNIVPATFTNNVFTLECWVKFNSLTTWQTLIKNWGDSFGGAFHFGLNGTGQKLEIIITQTNNASPGIADPTNMVTNVWTHVAAVADGSYIRLYKNGVQVASGAYDGTIKNSFAPLFIGAKPNDSGSAASISVASYLNGSMDEVRIWNVPRNQCEIQQYMNCEIPSTAPGLIANYHFNQGIPSGANSTQTVLTDAVGSNTGTLNTFVLSGSTSNWISTGGVITGSTTPASITTTVVLNGNGNNVPIGVITSTANNTDFGTNPSRTFSITNSGTGTLNLSGIYFTGANASQFSVTTSPASAITTGTTGFVIAYTPTSTSSASAVVNIVSNDCINPTYSFVVTASASPASALDFDGTDYVSIPYNSSFSLTTAFSVEFWIKFNSIAGAQELVSKGTDDAINGHFGFLFGNGYPKFTIYQGGFNNAYSSTLALSPGVWTHVAGTWDGSVMSLYVNGVLEATQPLTGPISLNTGNIQIGWLGKLPSYPYWTNGAMDEVRIWDVARTQCEIREYMNCEIPGSSPGLLANYHFNQGVPSGTNSAETTLYDAASGNNGSLSGFALTGSSSNWINPGGVTSGSTTPAALSETLNVKGNGNNVPVGVATSTTNFTDFSTNTTRVFVAENIGTGALYINSISFTGAGASQFTVSSAPAPSLAGSGTSSFTVLFTPTVVGTSSAIVNINSSDCSTPNYSFVITASTSAASVLNFDGSDDIVVIPSVSSMSFGTSTDLTVEAMIQFTANHSGFHGIVAKADWGGSWQGYQLAIVQNKIAAELGTPAGLVGTANGLWGTTSLNDGQWHHVAFTVSRSSNTAKLYVDGVQEGIATTTAISTDINSGEPTLIGSERTYVGYFNGSIDEVRIWNTVRTQCEILTYKDCEIPNTPSGLVANYHFNQGVPAGANLTYTTLTDVAGTNHGTLTNFSLTPGPYSNWIVPGLFANGYTTTTVPTGTLAVYGGGNFVPIGATTSTLNYTDFETNNSRTFIVYNPAGAGPVYINSISFSGANASNFSVTSLPSSSLSGNGNSAFVISFTPTSVSSQSAIVTINSSDCTNPNYSFVITASTSPASAINFDGIDDQVVIPYTTAFDNLMSGNFSFEAWIYPTTTGLNTILSKGHGGGVPGTGEYILQLNTGSNQLSFFHSAQNGWKFSNGGVPLNAWSHVAVTFDGTYVKFYINGILDATRASTAVTNYTTGPNPVYLARQGHTCDCNYFNGSIDEVRIWTVPRTQCEILTYMNAEITSTASGLLANYHFNQGIPAGSNSGYTVVTDATGINDGTLAAMALTGATSNWVSPGGVVSGSNTPAVPGASMTITGNAIIIPPGSISTTTNNFTDFGTASSRTFAVLHSGTGTLYIGNGLFSGANASNFSLTTYPSTLMTSGASPFVITFSPTSVGTHSAVFTVFSSDCTTPQYSFVITASASPASSLRFDGGSGYVNLGSGTNLKPTSAITAEAWVNAGNWPSVDQTFVGNTENNGWGLLTRNVTGNLEAYLRRNGTWATVGTPLSAISPGWHHVAMTFDGRYTKLYLDGELKNMDDAGATYTVDYNPFNSTLIGAEAGGGSTPIPGWAFTGSIDEVRIWNTARTQCEILTYMNCEIPTTTTNLVANYHFNQGLPSGSNTTVTTLTDAAGSNTGTLMSVALTGTASNWIDPGGVISGSITPAVLNQTISLSGNGNPIPVGSATGTLNFTDFGSSTTRVYSINNTGTGVLYVNPTISLSGTDAADFSVTALPATSVSGIGSTTFAVSFIPSSLGTKTAVVHIISSDCTVPEFTYVITANPAPAEALNFNGTSGQAAGPLFNTQTTDVTLQAKVFWFGTTSGSQSIIYNGNTSSSGYGIYVGTSGDVFLLMGGIGGVPSNYTLTPNQWTYLSVVITGSKVYFYANGVLTNIGDQNTYGYPNFPTGNLSVGANGGAAEIFKGTIDEVLFWSRPLSQCEIQAYSSCEITGTLTGLEANYHFNQGVASGVNSTVTVVTDASGNGHDLNITGMTLSGAASNWVTPGAVISGSSCPTFTAPEIAVIGGTTSLVSGDALPSVAKDTDYGNISSNGITVHTFTIQNTGNGSLSVSSITMSGADAGSYLVGSLIPSSPIAAGNFAVFNVTFAPSSSGTKTAMVNVSSDDCDETVFTYMLTGSGANGQSFVFDGTDDYITCGNILTASYTKEAWINIGTSTNGNNFISTGTGVVGSAFWAPGIYSYKLSAGHDGIWNQVQDPTALSTNTWYHVAVTYDAPSTTMNLYKNGVLVASSNTVQPYSGSTPLQLGAYAGTYVVNGSMDEVRIWNRALCVSEIVNNMNCEIQTTASGLVANYHFNQGTAYGANNTQTIVTDFSGAGNTGTLVNAALSGTTSNWQFPTTVTSGSFCPAITVPEINLIGNGVSIADGKTVSATVDHTDFGSVCINTVMVRTYTVQNTGAGPLGITNMSMSGTDASLFTISGLSPSSPISAGNSAVFSVTFAPASAGTKTATIVISNDDCTESTYDFVLTGTCNALPVVTATASSSVICNGATVTLNGGGADTYTWTGGTPTVTDNVAFTPSTTLTYTVSGTNITTGCTSTNVAVQSVTVNPSPTISATVSNSVICAGETTTIFPANAGTYTLMPGPLSGTSIAVSPIVTTTYTLTGTSLNGCNSVNNIPITITVNALPTVTANATSSVVCDGFTTSVYGSGADTYTWTGGVTNSVAFVPLASQDYTLSGTYTLTGCTSTNIATQSIVVNALPGVTASAINSVICDGSQATLTASGATNYTWMPGPVFGATVTVSPSALTIYTVTGTSTANCTSTNLATQTISVNPLPTVTANISNSLVCEGGSVTLNGSGADTYTWTGGATEGLSFTVSVNSTYSVTGTNTLTGCTSTNNAAVTVSVNSLPTITVNISDPAICMGNSVTLSAGGGTSYVWSGAVNNNVAFSPTATADYTVTGTDANSCVNSAIVTVTVNPLPVLSVAATNSLNCEAQTNTLTVTGASTYTWSGGETSGTVVITPTVNTSYTVTGTDANGCEGQLIYTQSVTPCSDTILVSTLLVDESCKGKANGSAALSFTTTQQNYQASYYWSEPTLCPNNDCDSLGNLKAGIYSVKIKITYTVNSILVRSDSITSNFEIREGSSDCVLKVYSGITHNDDGVNDFMYIENIEQYPNNTVTIFTRWGEQIYTMKGYNNAERVWPIEGELSKLSSNTYFYVLDPGDGGKVIKGWIELIKK